MATYTGDIRYDRRVSPVFLDHFCKGGVAHSLVEYAKHARFPIDLQLRHNPKTGADHATLYAGLTGVLNVLSRPNGHLALTAHETWTTGPYGFDSEHHGWASAASEAAWRSRWRCVEDYLEQVIPVAASKHGSKEGGVQAAVSAFSGRQRIMLDREVIPHFLNSKVREQVLVACWSPLVDALNESKPAPGKVPQRFGAECDLLALDRAGRLLAVEVKPNSGGSIAWVAAQATMYARVMSAWVNDDDEWNSVIAGMVGQRQLLGLAPKGDFGLTGTPKIVPVVALQRGAPQHLIARMWAVQSALVEAGVGDPDLEVYEVSLSGRLDPLTPSGG